LATTDPNLALKAVKLIRAGGFDVGLLHGARKFSQADPFGDADIVVGRPAKEVVAAVGQNWMRHDIFPVVVWPYDVGGSASVFLMNATASKGAQLDLLHDPKGLGRYGLRSGEFQIVQGSDPPTVSEMDELIYLWAKRSIKGPRKEVAHVEAASRDNWGAFLTQADKMIAHPDLRRRLGRKRSIGPEIAREIERSLRQAVRVAGRLWRPVGFWIHSPDPAPAEDLHLRFGRVMPGSRVGAVPVSFLEQSMWLSMSVIGVKWRPAVYVSFGPSLRTYFKPDFVVDSPGTNSNGPAREVVKAMSSRFVS
jgi:hypothetical protein